MKTETIELTKEELDWLYDAAMKYALFLLDHPHSQQHKHTPAVKRKLNDAAYALQTNPIREDETAPDLWK